MDWQSYPLFVRFFLLSRGIPDCVDGLEGRFGQRSAMSWLMDELGCVSLSTVFSQTLFNAALDSHKKVTTVYYLW
jgi:hypothetical protein